MDWSVNNVPARSDERDYSLFIHDTFHALISAESTKCATQRQKIKPDQKWDDITAREILAYILVRILIYIRLRFAGNS
jgi:hypothetical protein